MNLPTDIEAEQAVIGACLLGGLDASQEAVERIHAGIFFDPELAGAFVIIKAMVEENREIDPLSFKDEWKRSHEGKEPPQKVSRSVEHGVTGVLLDYHIKRVDEVFRRRKTAIALDSALVGIQDESNTTDQVISDLESGLLGIEGDRPTASVEVPAACQGLVDDLQRRFDLQGKPSGVITGFVDLDEKTDGLQFGEQTLIAARPSAGKTALGLNILHRACLVDKVPCLFVTCEMSVPLLMRRLLSSWANIPLKELRSGNFDQKSFVKFSAFQRLCKESPLHFVNGVSGMNISHLSACVKRSIRTHKIKLVIIDYLQKIRPMERHEKRTYEVAEVSGQLKAIAESTGTAFLTLAQLNRESVKDKTPRPPRLSDLADSGQIERDADTVMLIHRDYGNPSEAKIIIAKQRDGETCAVDMDFNGAFCRFQSLSRVRDEDVPSNRQHPD